MRSSLSIFLSLFLLQSLLSAPTFAQSGRSRKTSEPAVEPARPALDPNAAPVQSGDDGDDVIRIDSTLVTVPVVVRRGDRYLAALKKDQFRLFEDGTPQDISFFTAERVPFHVALVIDQSFSAGESLKDMKEAAMNFVDQLQPKDKVSVVAFDAKVRLACDFTGDRKVIAEAIDGITAGYSTRLYDAIWETVAQRMAAIEGRKAIIVLTDGGDTASRKKFNQALDAVRENDTLAYVIRYPVRFSESESADPKAKKPRNFPFPRRPRIPYFRPAALVAPQSRAQASEPGRKSPETFLDDLVGVSGGNIFDAKRLSYDELDGVFRQIADELRNVYVLGFQPTRPLTQGGFRKLRVEVKLENAVVRAREGYVARPRQTEEAAAQTD
jgi:VWFA-related protein